MGLSGPSRPEMRIWPRFFCGPAEGVMCVTPVAGYSKYIWVYKIGIHKVQPDFVQTIWKITNHSHSVVTFTPLTVSEPGFAFA